MARMTRFTDPSSGRFVSPDDVGDLENAIRRVYDNGELQESVILHYGVPEAQFDDSVEPNWREDTDTWGASFRNDDNDLSLAALAQSDAPDGARAFRVRYNVATNPDYPQGFASGGWIGIDQWPPSLEALENVAPVGIAMIHFDMRQ